LYLFELFNFKYIFGNNSRPTQTNGPPSFFLKANKLIINEIKKKYLDLGPEWCGSWPLSLMCAASSIVWRRSRLSDG